MSSKRSPPIDHMIFKSYNKQEREIKLYDYVNTSGINEIEQWLLILKKKNKIALSKINAKINILKNIKDPSLMPNILEKVPGSTHLLELKTTGRTSHRIILCRGLKTTHGFHDCEGENIIEYTFLMGCQEKDSKYIPENTVSSSESKRKDVISDQSNRRKPHEEVRP